LSAAPVESSTLIVVEKVANCSNCISEYAAILILLDFNLFSQI
jgi:hypothetical protein